jgi:hypothetical protein
MKIEETYTAFIYVGFRERDSGIGHTLIEAESICQEFCDKIGLCVTVTPTKFIYTNGREDGCVIGFINYPRFPDKPEHIKDLAVSLGKIFLDRFKQYKVSIVCSNKTYMIESE